MIFRFTARQCGFFGGFERHHSYPTGNNVLLIVCDGFGRNSNDRPLIVLGDVISPRYLVNWNGAAGLKLQAVDGIERENSVVKANVLVINY